MIQTVNARRRLLGQVVNSQRHSSELPVTKRSLDERDHWTNYYNDLEKITPPRIVLSK